MLTILQMLKAKNNENMIRDVSTSKEEIDLKLTIRQWLNGKDGTVHFANSVSRFELDEYG